MSKVKENQRRTSKESCRYTKQQNEMLRTVGVLEAQKQGIVSN